MSKISVIVLARNEAEVIEDCLKSVKWAEETVLVDTGITDGTLKIGEKYGVKVVKADTNGLEFARWRNLGKEKARGDWVFYVDADERVTPQLREEIQKVINKLDFAAYEIPRRNFFLGKEMRYGGAWPDYVKRLYQKKKLKRWVGKLHESPVVEGKIGKLQNPLIHQTHRDLTSMMNKTIAWTAIEADLLYQTKHPPVVWWRFLRMMADKFFQRMIKQSAWRDGTEGFINAIFETFNTFIIYARLWEMQQGNKK
jgi:glycosyltransferase involved in cell wall biosynthesis